jgi:phage terminase small subunit
MSVPAAKLFRAVVLAVQPQHFLEADRGCLEQYCEAWALARLARATLAEQGPVIANKANAWVAIQKDAMFTMGTLATKLRLVPQSRVAAKSVREGRPDPLSLVDFDAVTRHVNG